MEEECTHRFIDLYDKGHWHCRECKARGTDPNLAEDEPTPLAKITILYALKNFIGIYS